VKPKFIYRGQKEHKKPRDWSRFSSEAENVKTKIKIGWHIWNTEDYIVVNRCYKCNMYNHRASNCRGIETCPLCTGGHKFRGCTASADDYKCINCVNINKHNSNAKVGENHSCLDKNCPSLQAITLRYRQNTDYWMATMRAQFHKKRTRDVSLRCRQLNLQHSRPATDNFNFWRKLTWI
jgi:hypothetical protein